MRASLAFLSLVLASGALVASDNQDDFHWIQFQGGITDHRTKNPDHMQPAAGFGVGTWLNGHWGLEASGVGTLVNYGSGTRSKEAHATGSVLFNPFHTPQTFRPFLRLGLGTTTIGSPMSGTGSHTTRLSGVVGVGVQALLGYRMFASLEGRIVQIESNVSRKEGQALLGIGVRWGNHEAELAAAAAASRVEAPASAPITDTNPGSIGATTAPVTDTTQAKPTDQLAGAMAPTSMVDIESLSVHFGTNKFEPTTAAAATVKVWAAKYLSVIDPNVTSVIGHTDSRGSRSWNERLSLMRAQSVADMLKGNGLNLDGAKIEGHAFDEPIGDNNTEEGRALNRRTDVTFKDGSKFRVTGKTATAPDYTRTTRTGRPHKSGRTAAPKADKK